MCMESRLPGSETGDARREIKVRLRWELWHSLQVRKLLRGEGLSATVERALDAYFAQVARQPPAGWDQVHALGLQLAAEGRPPGP
jgi:hypothetical protein